MELRPSQKIGVREQRTELSEDSPQLSDRIIERMPKNLRKRMHDILVPSVYKNGYPMDTVAKIKLDGPKNLLRRRGMSPKMFSAFLEAANQEGVSWPEAENFLK